MEKTRIEPGFGPIYSLTIGDDTIQVSATYETLMELRQFLVLLLRKIDKGEEIVPVTVLVLRNHIERSCVKSEGEDEKRSLDEDLLDRVFLVPGNEK